MTYQTNRESSSTFLFRLFPILVIFISAVATKCSFAFQAEIPSKKICHEQRFSSSSLETSKRDFLGTNNKDISRNDFLKTITTGGVLSSMLALNGAKPVLAAIKSDFEKNLATILLSKKVLTPALRYIEIGQYDPARTNVNYCVNQLKLRKALVAAVDDAQDFVEDFDLLSEAIEFVTRADNIIVQLDSSIYTMIFIPVESKELPPDAIKFQKQCFLYYDLTMKGLDDVIALASPEQLRKAEEIANSQSLPKFLFKEFKGDFYRPGTP